MNWPFFPANELHGSFVARHRDTLFVVVVELWVVEYAAESRYQGCVLAI